MKDSSNREFRLGDEINSDPKKRRMKERCCKTGEKLSREKGRDGEASGVEVKEEKRKEGEIVESEER